MRLRNITALFSTSLLACIILSAQPSLSQTRQWLAQNGPSQPGSQQTRPQPEAPQLTVPRDDVLLLLIRATLIALNQANVTGNYSVLRDLAAPSFKEANSPERLAQIFGNMRKRNLDLAPVLTVMPKLYRKAEITPKGMLRITGFFPMESERINFDLMFEPVQGRWRLSDIVQVSAGAAQPQQAPAAKAAPQAAPDEALEAGSTTKPAASSAKTQEKPKPAETSGTATKKPSATEVDIRDRLDNQPPPPPENEKPKEKGFWNPFDR